MDKAILLKQLQVVAFFAVGNLVGHNKEVVEHLAVVSLHEVFVVEVVPTLLQLMMLELAYDQDVEH